MLSIFCLHYIHYRQMAAHNHSNIQILIKMLSKTEYFLQQTHLIDMQLRSDVNLLQLLDSRLSELVAVCVKSHLYLWRVW